MNDKILEEFEDSLLSESIDNEDGLLVCEIEVFRRNALKALKEQSQQTKEELREAIKERKCENCSSEGFSPHNIRNRAIDGILSLLKE